MKDVQISYVHILVEDADAGFLATVLNKALDEKGEPLSFSISKAPDVERTKFEESVREELKNTLIAESQKYSNYWLQERAESDKLRKRVKELEEK